MSARSLSASDLLTSERFILDAMRQMEFGRFEWVSIRHGELVLDPWPTTIRGVKFGSDNSHTPRKVLEEFRLKQQVAEFFEYVRSVESGEIRCLEVRHGLPFSMEVEHRSITSGASSG